MIYSLTYRAYGEKGKTMKIKMNIEQTHNGYELDTSAIKLQSMDNSSIHLSYTGSLPVKADSAYVALKMMPTQAGAVLVCKVDGKEKRYVLEYSVSEIKELLEKFFFSDKGNTRFDNGLDRYWLGLWTAHYLDWKRTEAA